MCTYLQLQAFFLVIDDIEDGSLTRRNQQCWYLHNDIGLAAINDGIILEMAIYQLLRTHFKSKDCYLGLMELFLNVSNTYATSKQNVGWKLLSDQHKSKFLKIII